MMNRFKSPCYVLFLLWMLMLPLWGETAETVLGEKVFFGNVIRDGSGRLLSGNLSGETALTFEGMKLVFKKGSDLALYNTGNLRRGVLAKEFSLTTPYGPLPLAPDSVLTFGKDKKTNLRKSRLLLSREGVLKKETLEIHLRKKSEIYFLTNTELDWSRSRLYLARTLSYPLGKDVLPLKIDSLLSFYSSGILKSCMTASVCTVRSPGGAFKIKGDQKLYLTPSGVIELGAVAFSLDADTLLKVRGREYLFKGGDSLEFYENGWLRRGVLAGDAVIPVGVNLIPVKKGGGLYFLPSGLVDGTKGTFELTRDSRLTVGDNEVEFQAASKLSFYSGGILREGTLVKDKESSDKSDSGELINNNRLIVGENTIAFKGGSQIAFYPNGTPRQGILATGSGPLKIRGLEIPLASGTKLSFYDDGRINSSKTELVTESPFPVIVKEQSLSLKKGTRLYFKSDGTLDVMKIEIIPARDSRFEVQGVPYLIREGSPIVFFEGGGVKKLALTKGAQINLVGQDLSLSGDISFFESGGISDFALFEKSFFAVPAMEEPLELPEGSRIYLNQDGGVNRIYLNGDFSYSYNDNIYNFKGDSSLHLYPRGGIQTGVLGEVNVIRYGNYNLPLEKGRELVFNPEGEPKIESVTLEKALLFSVGAYRFELRKDSVLKFGAAKKLRSADSVFYLNKDTAFSVGGNQFTADKEHPLKFYSGGEIREIKQKGQMTIKVGKDLFPLKGDRIVHFLREGYVDNLKTSCQLAKVYVCKIDNVEVPLAEGTRLYFRGDKQLDFEKMSFSIHRDVSIKVGKLAFKIKKGTVLFFTPQGKLKNDAVTFVLTGPQRLAVKSSLFNFNQNLFLYADGSIKEGFVEGAFSLKLQENEIAFRGNKKLYFNPAGDINQSRVNLTLERDAVIAVKGNRFTFKGGSDLVFYSNGILKRGYIDENVSISIGKYTLPAKGKRLLYFSDDGEIDSRLTHLVLEKEKVITLGGNDIPFLADTRLYFDHENTLTQGILGQDKDLGVWNFSIPFSQGKRLYFLKNGNIDSEKTEIYLRSDKAFYVGEGSFTFGKGRRIYFYPDGKIHKGYLAGDAVVKVKERSFAGDPAEVIEFYPDGGVKEITLKEKQEQLIGGGKFLLAGKSSVLFHTSGAVSRAEPAEDVTIKAGSGPLSFKRYSPIEFYSDEKVKKGMLREPSVIKVGANRLKISSQRMVEFHKNGAFASGVLTNDAKFSINNNPVTLKEHTPIDLYSNGIIRSAYISESMRFSTPGGSVELNPNSTVTFFNNGRLKEGYPRLPFTLNIQGRPVTFDSKGALTFYEKGALKEGVLLKQAVLRGITYQKGSTITFYENGRVQSGFPALPSRLKVFGVNFVFAPFKEIYFKPNGNLLYGNIYEKVFAGGRNYYPGEWVYISAKPGGRDSFYPVKVTGELEKDTPVIIGKAFITFPAGTRIAFKGDDTLFKVIVPSGNLFWNGRKVARNLVEIYYTDLTAAVIGE